MKWRLLRPPYYQSRRRILCPKLQEPRRDVATLTLKDESIATILSKEPSTLGPLKPIVVTGSVRTVRKQKHHCFLEVGDGSTSRTLQAVLEPRLAEGLGTGTSVALMGVWQRSPAGKEQPYELSTQEVRILGPTDAEVRYPLQKKFHTAEYLRTIPHLRLRTPFGALLARLRSDCDHFLGAFFHNQSFIRLQPPIVTSSDCEGAGEVFTVSANSTFTKPTAEGNRFSPRQDHFFRDPKYLTVSSQLHLEACVHEHPKVWTLSPTFRADRSNTPRHVSEFWMLEAEVRTETLWDIMNLVETSIKHLIANLRLSTLLEELSGFKHGDSFNTINDTDATSNLTSARWDGLEKPAWPRITYTEAVSLLQSTTAAGTAFSHPPSWRSGLQYEHEKFIAQEVGQGSPVFVTDYPQETRPFYMLPSVLPPRSLRKGRSTSACFDLLLPNGCEVVGGSLREHRLEPLLQSMRKQGLEAGDACGQSASTSTDASPSSKSGNLDWYVDLRRYGSVPHGGFGLGFDRLLGYLAGVHNIRDVVPWPRYYGRCDC